MRRFSTVWLAFLAGPAAVMSVGGDCAAAARSAVSDRGGVESSTAVEAGPYEPVRDLPALVVGDSLQASLSFTENNRFLRTSANIVIVNQVIWAYNRYLRDEVDRSQFAVGWDTFADNVAEGYEWDDNGFFVNHIYHPLQGSLHHTAARANDYNYWQSGVWALAGSWLWEHLAENNPPSTNDFINSSVGGMAIGESAFRFSSILLDNRATGAERVLREAGGALLAPARALNRVMTGEMFRVHRNPPARGPSSGFGEFRGGFRSLASGDDVVAEGGFFQFNARYGNPFDECRSPFSYFDLDFIYNPADGDYPLGRAGITGILGGWLRGPASSQHRIGFFQRFEYENNAAFEFGYQGVSIAWLGRVTSARGLELRPTLHIAGILLGATRSDHAGYEVRTYDHGVGGGYEATLAVVHDGYEYAAIMRSDYLLTSVDGSSADHHVSFTRLRTWLPLPGVVALGGEYVRYRANRRYHDFAGVRAENEEVRFFVSMRLR